MVTILFILFLFPTAGKTFLTLQFNLPLNLVYKMADIISDSVAAFVSDCGKNFSDIAI